MKCWRRRSEEVKLNALLIIDVKVKDELNTKIEILATKEDIHSLRNEVKDNTISMQKWMLGTFITLVVMILGLYATILLKH